MTSISIPFKSTFQQLQKIDVAAGKVFGNADHIRAQNTDGLSYATGLGVRIVMVTTTAVLLQLMAIIIASLHEPTLTAIAAVGWALPLWHLSQSVLPKDHAFALTLLFELGFFPMIVFNTFLQYPGMSFLEAYRSLGVMGWLQAFTPMLVTLLILSAGFSLMRWIVKCVVEPFRTDDSEEQRQARKAYRKAMRDFKRAHWNASEQQAYGVMRKIALGFMVTILLAFGGFLVSAVTLSLPGIGLSFVGIIAVVLVMIPCVVIEERWDRTLLARLKAEGVELPDPALFGVVKKTPSDLERRIQAFLSKGGDRRDEARR